MKAIALLNGSAGGRGAAQNQSVREAVAVSLEKAGIEADIRLARHGSLRREAERALESDADVIIAGGGDGTVSTVAGVLAGTDRVLGILPLGTLNHFAKDLGLPQTIPEAADVIAAANVGTVDLGMVNERAFINNSSLGVYPRTVLERDAHRDRYKVGKWLAKFWAVLKTFRRFPLVSVRIDTAEQTSRRKTPLVFVGNNEYQLEKFNVGARSCLDGGRLALYVANTQSRWGMLRLTFRALAGRLKQDRDFESVCLTECWIETRRRWLHVAVDGEVLKIKPPLHYRILPGSLRVCLPPPVVPPVPAGIENAQVG